MKVRIRSTFIDTSAERSPSLEHFYRQREVTTCPAAHIGRLRGLFQEADGSGNNHTLLSTEPPDFAPHALHYAPPPSVRSLDDVIGQPSPPPQTRTLGSYQAYGGSFAHGLVGSAGVPLSNNLGWIGDLPPCGDVRTLQPPTVWVGQPFHAAWDSVAAGSEGLPSVGSAGHAAGRCKPCVFFHKDEGCVNGPTCNFCHLCEPEEKLRRKRKKQDVVRATRILRRVRQQDAAAVSSDQVPSLAFMGRTLDARPQHS